MSAAQLASSLAAAATVAVIVACGGGSEPRAPAAARPLPTSVCGTITFGGHGRPQLLIANSGVLQGPTSAHGLQNSQAAKLVLADRGWRAGRFTVGMQVCDEADAASPLPSPTKCTRNAWRFAADASVVAVIGPTSSTCAHAMIPVLNRARDGALALVSMSATYLGLTREGPGVAAGDPENLYPTGIRNYARVVPADDVQASAAALYLQGHGARRPYVLHHDESWGIGIATAFRNAAQRLGMTIAGIGRWDRRAAGYTRLAARIRQSGADAVYLAGYATDNGGRLLRDLRGDLGPGVLIMGPDGFNVPALLVEDAGEAAEGFVTTLATVPARAEAPKGRRFAREFRQRFGALPCCYSMQSAEAMEVVLNAIAKSDGSRASVLRNVFQTRVHDGLVGDVAIDRYGDSTVRKIAVYRIQNARARFLTVITPSEDLLARRR